jgi:DNA-binding NarL/FixJ family response regulator
LSSLLNATDKVKGFEVGAVDYISKPFSPEEMLARIESCLSLHEKIRQSQQGSVIEVSDEEREKNIQRYKLSEREVETLRLYALGHKHKDIADQLLVSENTVKWYLKKIFEKLKIDSRSQAIEKSHEIGLI